MAMADILLQSLFLPPVQVNVLGHWSAAQSFLNLIYQPPTNEYNLIAYLSMRGALFPH